MTTLWLARHAETAIPTVFHGAESDIGLSALGEQQAAAAAQWFRDYGLTDVVSSAMLRAQATAAPIAAACDVPHHIVPDLHERRVGVLTGTSFSTQDGAWPKTIAQWEAGNTAYKTQDAESFDELRDRLVPAFERVAARFPNGRVLVVAHGVVCKVLVLSLLAEHSSADWTRIGRVANLAVTEFQHADNTWVAHSRFIVPPPVAALSEGAPTGIGEKSQG